MTIKPLTPALLWLIVIVLLSTRATVPMPKFNLLGVDKLGHAGAYAVLCWLILWGLRRGGTASDVRGISVWATFLFATAFGVLMEFVQFAFFPGRFYELDDMLANAAGAAVACLVFPKFASKTLPR